MNAAAAFLVVLSASVMLAAQTPAAPNNPLQRTYRDGETFSWRMTGINEDWHYTIEAEDTVKKDPSGARIEELRWFNLTSDGHPQMLSPATDTFRQQLSLDSNRPPSGPDLTKVDPRLIGPITDLMTVYVDDWLANKTGQLHHAGDHLYVPNGMPSSWADGTRVLTGESAIDFDLTLKSVDPTTHTAVLLVHHVPPQKPTVHLAAEWMQAPVAGTANNWVGVTKTQDGKYEAAVGKETFDVTITVSTVDGRILSATMENLVSTVQRICEDAALTKCGDPQPHTIHRHIELALEP
jgi:hypothetical protein